MANICLPNIARLFGIYGKQEKKLGVKAVCRAKEFLT